MLRYCRGSTISDFAGGVASMFLMFLTHSYIVYIYLKYPSKMICIYIYMYIYMYIHMYTYTYVYIHE